MNDDISFITKKFENNVDDLEFIIKDDNLTIVPSLDPHSYLNLLYNSKFAILPRGTGYALSYRFIECMNLGCIPVIISDNYQLPFSNIIDYNTFTVIILEKDILDIKQILLEREKDINDIEYLYNNMIKIYQQYFSSSKVMLDLAIKLLLA